VTAFLSREQELDLAIRWRDHRDERAMHQIVRSHAALVKKIALKFCRFGIDLEDLIQEGNIGLLVAVDKFEPERGLRISTYARWWIKAQISELVLAQHAIVKHPRSTAMRMAFFNGKSRLVSFSIETPVSEGDDPIRFVDTLESDGPLPDEIAEEAIDGGRSSEILHETMHDALSAREQDIIRSRYLTDDGETLAIVAERHGISRERVRQIEVAAMNKLRKAMGAGVAA
jgi:RNA polymerase sigma-32 factor